jgi:hypothetical protein
MPLARKGDVMPLPNRDLSDWDWVRKQIAEDAPIPYDPNDPDDGPYDPNDDEAVEAFFARATIWRGWPNPAMIQKDGVPVVPSEIAASEADESQAKA